MNKTENRCVYSCLTKTCLLDRLPWKSIRQLEIVPRRKWNWCTLSPASSASFLLLWINRTTGLLGHSSRSKSGRHTRKNRESQDAKSDVLLPQHLLLPAAFTGHFSVSYNIARFTPRVGHNAQSQHWDSQSLGFQLYMSSFLTLC